MHHPHTPCKALCRANLVAACKRATEHSRRSMRLVHRQRGALAEHARAPWLNPYHLRDISQSHAPPTAAPETQQQRKRSRDHLTRLTSSCALGARACPQPDSQITSTGIIPNAWRVRTGSVRAAGQHRASEPVCGSAAQPQAAWRPRPGAGASALCWPSPWLRRCAPSSAGGLRRGAEHERAPGAERAALHAARSRTLQLLAAAARARLL